MLKLIEVGIGIRIIHQLVQELEGIPYWHLLFVEFQEFILLIPYEIISLIFVIQTIKFTYSITFSIVVVSEIVLVFFCNTVWIRIPGRHVIFPHIQAFKRRIF